MTWRHYLHPCGRHQMETFSCYWPFVREFTLARLEFTLQRPETQSFGVFFDLRLNKPLKQSRRRWFETPSRSLWRHCNVTEPLWRGDRLSPLSYVLQSRVTRLTSPWYYHLAKLLWICNAINWKLLRHRLGLCYNLKICVRTLSIMT